MRARTLLFASAILAPAACSSSPSPPDRGGVTLVPNVIVPQDLISEIATYQVQIFNSQAAGGLTCNTVTGAVGGNVSGATPIASTSTIDTNTSSASGMQKCSGGATRCTTLSTVAYQTDPSIISVTGFAADGKTALAVGCKQTMIDQATLDVSISLVRIVPKATCGNGVVEVGETCDEPTAPTAVCTKTCQTIEELLSVGGMGSKSPVTGSVGQKSNPSLLWGSGTGTAGILMAVFSDTAEGSTQQITARFMDDTLGPLDSTVYGPLPSTSSIFVPNGPKFPPPPSVNDAKGPAAATLSANDYVFYSSDAPGHTDAFDVYMNSFEQSDLSIVASSCLINVPKMSASYTATTPSVAASGDALYVAWQDNDGNVRGNIVTPPATNTCPTAASGSLGKESLLGGGSAPRVAATAGGWVVVWEAAGNVVMKLISGTGTARAQQIVGAGTSPQVASVPGNADFAVTWVSSGTPSIRLQRYSGGDANDGVKISAQDATANINTSADPVLTPAIAGGAQTQAGPFYVVTWIDQKTQSVMARLVSPTSGELSEDSAYLFNTINGLTTDFQVNIAPGQAPANPAVVVGGLGYIAFAWENHANSCPKPATFPGTPCFGVIARRFPLPSQ